MIQFRKFYQLIAGNHLFHWLEKLPSQIASWQRFQLEHPLKKWSHTLEFLPEMKPYELDLLNSVTVKSQVSLHKEEIIHLEKLLRNLMPWRKGPFHLYGVNIDTEWRADWKWDRVRPHLSNLTGRTVLDVGSNSGYHLWRMIGAGADLAIGIDPAQLFLYQFEAVRKLIGNDQRVHLLPLGIEQLPPLCAFDTVFSMGMLYHRRSPIEYISQLKDQLINDGELVLETLVIEGDENSVLVPKDRYAKMKNVYFIPSTLALKNWLMKCGFVNVRIVDITITSLQEQRRTDWMVTESLEQFLHPKDHSKTIEGYPAPMRAILIATKPSSSTISC